MTSPRHPDKDIRKAIEYALSNRWELKKLGTGGHSHPWGELSCSGKPYLSFDMWCRVKVNSTPRNPTNIAKMIRKKVDKCSH